MITFRPARPEDAWHIAPLIYSSGPDLADYVLKDRHTALRFLRWTLMRKSGEFGYRAHWVGEQDGRVVAVGAVFSGDTNLRRKFAMLGQVVRFFGLDAVGVLRRALKIESIVQPPPVATWYLAHLGVAEGLTGQGIGRQLIEHLLLQGRKEGLSLAALDVSSANPRAQKLYERLGFVVKKERASTLPDTIVDHRFMVRML
jgi:ribosomal protein S18 acetylase RimI-like enzyme